jgi:hypothetical protein
MKIHKWTLGLAAVGLVSLPAVATAEETPSESLLTALSSTVVSGYVSTSAHWNLGSGNLGNPGYSFGDTSSAAAGAGRKADGFNLDVVKVTIEKPLEADDNWAAGYKIEGIFGPDATTLATGNNIKQAYVQLRTPVGNGLEFKMGVFDTIIGYESFDSGNNPNYTRSWGYTIEPTTHTGLLASYQFNDMFAASVGIANTFGPAINGRAWFNPGGNTKAESYKTYMASLSVTAPEDTGWLAGSTLYAGIINGFNNTTQSAIAGTAQSAVQTSLYAGFTMNTPWKALKVGAAYDYAGVSEQQLTNGTVPSTYRNAIALYASYQLSEKLSLHGRGEYFTQSTPPAGVAGGGLTSKIISGTATVQYDLWANVLSRLEFRWDHNAGGGTAFETPGASVNKDNSYLLAANFIYKF